MGRVPYHSTLDLNPRSQHPRSKPWPIPGPEPNLDWSMPRDPTCPQGLGIEGLGSQGSDLGLGGLGSEISDVV